MTSVSPFIANRFDTAASHYTAGRHPYPESLVSRVARDCRLHTGSRVLDLGCGPAPLAIMFARRGYTVTAIDPSPEMLREGRHQAAAAAVEIEFVEGSSYSLPSDLAQFDVVTIGRAFHWMDRADTVIRLDQILDSAGAVALFDERYLDVPANIWRRTYREVYERYVEGGAARQTRYDPNWVADEAILLASPFSRLERLSAIEQLATPLDAFRHRLLSISVTSHGRIGTAADRLVEEMIAAMAPFAVNGLVPEVIEFTALLAYRPKLGLLQNICSDSE